MTDISVVLPAYNEEANLPRTVNALVETLEELGASYEIIVVDDGSRDRTALVASDLASRHPSLRLIQHEINQGYGQALMTGLMAARRDLAFFTDSDCQFDVSEISRLIPYLPEADIVIGYRAPRRDPAIRRINAFGWNTLVNLLFGYTARDIDCAFKLFKRSILDDLEVVSRGATFSAELLVRARARGYRVKEVPVSHYPRTAGSQTGARLHVILRAFRELVQFWLRFNREKRDSPVRASLENANRGSK